MAPMKIDHIHGVVSVVAPSRMHTPSIKPRAEAFTPSRNARKEGRVRNFAMNGLTMGTKMNEGRKMPTDDTIAPGKPRSRKPMKAAVERTGPGVN